MKAQSFGRFVVAVIATAIALLPIAAAAAYKLQPGDTVEISIAGLPDLTRKVRVNVDGEISVFLVGQMKVADLSLGELQDRLRTLLPAKAFRPQLVRGSTDAGSVVVLDPEQISVDIAEYRGVYVTGDVAKPGVQDFAPGLTVGRAVAVAGGFKIAGVSADTSPLDLADVRADFDNLRIDYAEAAILATRLAAELAGKDQIDPSEIAVDLPDHVVLDKMVALANETLKADLAAKKADDAYFASAVESAQQQVSTLGEATSEDKSVREAAASLTKKVARASGGSLLQVGRVIEAHQAVAAATTALYADKQRQGDAERALADRQHDRDKADRDWQAKLVEELGDVQTRIATIKSRIASASGKLQYAGAISLGSDNLIDSVEIVLRSGSDADKSAKTVDQQTALTPGDVIEVRLHLGPSKNVPVQ